MSKHSVHPFKDGNSRVGRLLVTLLLVEWGLLPGPMLDFSGYLGRALPLHTETFTS